MIVADEPSFPARPAHPSWTQRVVRAWSVGALPGLMVPIIAMGLGPQGLAIFGPDAVTLLDPAVPVALATIGVMAAFQMTLVERSWRVIVSSAVEALVAGLLVAVGLQPLVAALGGPAASLDALVVAAIAAVCAAASAPLFSGESPTSRPVGALIRDLDVFIPAIVGGFLLVWIAQPAVTAAIAVFGRALVGSVVVAAAGMLLLSGGSSNAEHRVFGIAMILVVAGSAEALGASALLSGLAAGVYWRAIGRGTRERLQPVVAYIQHPLLVLMLIVAGVRAEVTPSALALAAAYAVLRTAGKCTGAWVAAAICRIPMPVVAGHILSPGIFGLALALTLANSSARGPELLTIVLLGTIGSQVTAALLRPDQATA
jgi:hypothetical protein